jgi:hypothetical protein
MDSEMKNKLLILKKIANENKKLGIIDNNNKTKSSTLSTPSYLPQLSLSTSSIFKYNNNIKDNNKSTTNNNNSKTSDIQAIYSHKNQPLQQQQQQQQQQQLKNKNKEQSKKNDKKYL